MNFKYFSGLVFLCATISAPALANSFSTAVTNSFNGNVPTYYFDLPAENVLQLLNQDHSEGRSFGSQAKPSLLTSHVTAYENIPGLGSGKLANSFSASNQYICMTSLTVKVPKFGGTYFSQPGSSTTTTVTRNCGTSSNINLQTWQRVSVGLTGLYNSYKLAIVADPYGTSKVQAFRDNTAQYPSGVVPSNETWGLTFFDRLGAAGLAQEMLIVFTDYQ